MELFANICVDWKALMIFSKSSILDLWLSSEYTSEDQKLNIVQKLKLHCTEDARKEKHLHRSEEQVLQERRGVMQKYNKIDMARYSSAAIQKWFEK